MKVQVLLFGQLAELIGETQVELYDVADTDAASLALLSTYPQLKQVNYQVAVNHDLIHENVVLTDGMTVALMPPFSGG